MCQKCLKKIELRAKKLAEYATELTLTCEVGFNGDEKIKPKKDCHWDDFYLFWMAYPALQRKDKHAAKLQWAKIEWSESLRPNQVVKSVLEHKKTIKWKEGYVVSPDKYLRHRLWEDPITEADMVPQYASTDKML